MQSITGAELLIRFHIRRPRAFWRGQVLHAFIRSLARMGNFIGKLNCLGCIPLLSVAQTCELENITRRNLERIAIDAETALASSARSSLGFFVTKGSPNEH